MGYKSNVDNVIPVLMQNLKEEEAIAMWLRANTPSLFAKSWPRIEEAAAAAAIMAVEGEAK